MEDKLASKTSALNGREGSNPSVSTVERRTVAAKSRGKSGLHRTRCWLTARRREATDSATESRQPMARKGSGNDETAV